MAGDRSGERTDAVARGTREALTELAYATIGLGGVLADSARRGARATGRGFRALARRGRMRVGSVPAAAQAPRRPVAATAQTEPGAHNPDYASMTVAELRERAKHAGVPGRSGMSKRQLIAALRARDAGGAA